MSPPAGHAHRAHCGTTRFLILSRLAEGGHFRELCLPPRPPRSFQKERKKTHNPREGWEDGTPPHTGVLRLPRRESQKPAQEPAQIRRAKILFLVAALSEWSRRTWILRQKWPPSSRRRPPRSSSTSTHPNPRRASTTSPSTRWTPRRCRRAALPLPGAYKPCLPDAPLPPPALLSSAPLPAEATLHRRGRAPPRRGTKVILTDLRKHDDLNGEVGFIVFKPDDRFDGPSGTASSCATTRTSSSPRDQTCSSTRAHLRRAPLHPRARRSVTLRSAPRAARAGASTTTRSSRSSTASSRSSD